MAKANRMTLSPFHQLNEEIWSRHEDQSFWWGILGQSFATLLKTSQYGQKEQLHYLRWFQQWIPSSLGPRPVDGKPHYGATFTYDGSPLEYSLNWKEKKAGQTIRFTVEPCSQEAGTANDPLNQLASRDLLTAMAKDVSGIDLTRFKIFLEGTNVPDEGADEVLSKLPPGHPRFRLLVAFDLEQGAVVAKAYFNPELRAIHTGVSTKTVVFDAIRKCNGPAGSYDTSIAVLRDYLETFDAFDGPQIILLSNDCVVDSPASRIKAYVSAPVRTLAQVKNTFHLGGRLSSTAIKAGLKAIGELWCHLFGLVSSDTDIEDKEILAAGSRCNFCFEMKPTMEGQLGTDMEVKIDMPASWFGQTDAQICEVLSTWFRKHGHPDFAARYRPDLVSTFPKIDPNTPEKLTHTFVSLKYHHKTGLYMSTYYTPKLTQFY